MNVQVMAYYRLKRSPSFHTKLDPPRLSLDNTFKEANKPKRRMVNSHGCLITRVEDVKGGGGVVGAEDVVEAVPEVDRQPRQVQHKEDNIHYHQVEMSSPGLHR